MKILINTKPFNEEELYPLKDDFKEVNFVFEQDKDKIKSEIKDADVFIARVISDEALDGAEKLKWIQAITAGVDLLPLSKINSMNIVITTARGVHKSHITEYVLSMMILSARNLHKFILQQDKKEINWRGNSQDEISGKKLGILGLGSVGQELAKKANFLGMEVYGIKRKIDKIDYVKEIFTPEHMEWIFENCDYIVNLLPYTNETKNLINKKYFDMLKPNCTMINVGRGKTVNEDDLYVALKNNQFKLYISDVFAKEPLPNNSPLMELDNIIITPHIAGPIVNYSKKLYEVVKPNIEAFINGEELSNKYDLNKGY
jgi:phosphoglycerate dehydrogenase-like enzyme